ncbi:MAG TPA: hypothetical protein VIE68_02765 [Gemmatimonadota bacterium]
MLATAARAQDPRAAERSPLPEYGEAGGFDAAYPVRGLSIESGRVLERGRGLVGFGDTRYAPFDRVEIMTNTIEGLIGVANGGVKVLAVRARGSAPSVAVSARYYESYGGFIDKGVKHIAESFADVTDSETDVRGVVGQITATWTGNEDRTHYHVSLQGHHPIESEFGVTDSVAGGGGSVRFLEGDDVSTMWGVDHQVIDTRLVALLEAGYSWLLERGRLGLGVDTGSQHMRVRVGVMVPGIKTDLATEPTDLVVTPVLSVHWRF